MDLIQKVGKWLHNHFDDFTKPVVLFLAAVGIVFAIIGHYGTVGFNFWWFFFWDVPLYLFCIWALYKAYKLYKMIKK